jgi:hypothetical protein
MNQPRGKVLLIDDLRDLLADVTARTYDEGVRFLEAGNIRLLKLDHDLGDTNPHKTGYGIILLLEECPELQPEEIELVTANPVGKTAMEAGLQSMGYRFFPATARWFKAKQQPKEET